MRKTNLSRREFLQNAGLLAGTIGLGLGGSPQELTTGRSKPKVAAIFTLFNYRSHAHAVLENFLSPYLFNGELADSGVELVSFCADQMPQGDMARDVSRQYGIPLYRTIDEALCLGGKELAVDAVLSIGEHGDYPVNDLGQRMYPRKRFFDESVAVMKRSGRFVPLFNDKHLSYRWDWAKEMVDTSRSLGIPFMAGSSVPLAERRPPLEIPHGSEIEEAVAIHGGPFESYDFHGLEVLQAMVESRSGGETGISRIKMLTGEALFTAAEQGQWSLELAEAAMAAELGERPKAWNKFPGDERSAEPHGILVSYKDGLRAAMVRLGSSATRWNFACRLRGDPTVRATRFYTGPWQNRSLFRALAHAIQHFFIHRDAPYPVERTLLTTGALEAAVRSRAAGDKPLDTPHLELSYRPKDYRALREMGATWKFVTEQLPQPKGINTGDRDLLPN